VTKSHLFSIESGFWLSLFSFAATNIAFPEGDPISLNIALSTVLLESFIRAYIGWSSKLLTVPAFDKDALS
jgi:hypothetical protein